MKKNLYEKLTDCAKLLEDEKHISILFSACDLVVQETKYHLNRFTAVHKSMLPSDNKESERKRWPL